jgi:hypothetical protein
MRIEIAEFVRRFLLHVLPNGFHRTAVSVLRNSAIDCRRPRSSLRSTGAVTIATIAAAPTRRSRRHHRSSSSVARASSSPRTGITKMESATSSAAAAPPRRLEPVGLLGAAAALIWIAIGAILFGSGVFVGWLAWHH